MRACSLNYRDLMMVKGQYNPSQRLPLIPLSDGVGEVVQVGEGTRRVKLGDRVAGAFLQRWIDGEFNPEARGSTLGGPLDGMLTEARVLSEEGLVRVPEHLSDLEAACLPCAALTAWHALVFCGRIKAGDTVLLQGTGGVSIFGLQFARLAGARPLIISSSDEKLQRARQLGAWQTVNYRNTPDWDKKVRELTGGGADLVLEVGGAGTLARSLNAVRLGGSIQVVGVLGGVNVELPVTSILMKGACLQGIFVGSRRMFEEMNRAIAASGLKPVVDRVFPFAEAPAAFSHMESGQHFGKIVIQF